MDYQTEPVSDQQGGFRFDGVPPGTYKIYPQLGGNSRYLADAAGTIEVKAGLETAASIVLKRAVAIRGKVLDRKTGRGIKDVEVLLHIAVSPKGTTVRSATTDARGEYVVYVKPGQFTISVNRVPDDYVLPAHDPRKPVAIAEDAIWPTIELDSTTAIEGIVVDESGGPVPGADIDIMIEDSSGVAQRNTQSDQSGKFAVRGVMPYDAIALCARAGEAPSNPLILRPGKAQGAVRIVVSKKNAFALRGTVKDDTGRPVRDAQVYLEVWRAAGSTRLGSVLPSSITDARGWFEFRRLWPGDEYTVTIIADDCDSYDSPSITGLAGQVHDFSTIVLASSCSVVEGTVVDSARKPLAGVQVFNSGDARQPTVTTSDGQGRFRLEGLHLGRVYVFARHPGYRFTAVRCNARIRPDQARTHPVEIILPGRTDSLPSASDRALPADYPSLEEQREIARKILERLWQTEDHEKVWRAVTAMARIDPDCAMKWAAQIGRPEYEALVRSQMPLRVAVADTDGALAMLSEGGARGFPALRSLAERLATEDPATAMRCAEEAVLRARNCDQPLRAVYLAQAGQLVSRLGDRKTGRKLVDEAVAMLARIPSGDRRQRAVVAVAKALAAFDPDHAVSFLQPITDRRERDRHLVDMAIAAASCDLSKAKAILEGVDPWYAGRAIAPMAYQVALVQPEDAVQLIRQYDARGSRPSSDAARIKAEALGWVALAITPQDKSRAWALIDEALDLCVLPNQGSWLDYYGGRTCQAAMLWWIWPICWPPRRPSVCCG